MAFVTSAALPRSGISHNSLAVCAKPATTAAPLIVAPLEIQAAKHVQFKAAKKADRCRPKKHRPSDKNRKPPPFDPEPLRAEDLPEYEIVKAESPEAAAAALEEAMAVVRKMKESGEGAEKVLVPAVEPFPYRRVDINELDLPKLEVGSAASS